MSSNPNPKSEPSKLMGSMKGQRNAYGFAFTAMGLVMLGIYVYGEKGINRNIFEKDL